ncbi:MAG: amidohydrolase family protein [Beijerinckiaceae bacterium]
MSSFLISNPKGILTGLDGARARQAGDIRVRDGMIAEIGTLTPERDEEIVDASGCVVTPGLVNTHHHLFQSVMKAAPQGINEELAKWLRLVPYRYWDAIDEEALRVSATIGLAELVLSGATSVADHHYLFSPQYDFDPLETLFGVAGRFGVRFVLCRGGATKGRNFDGDNTTPLPTETVEAMIGAVEDAAGKWNDPAPDAMRRIVMAPTTPTFSLEEGELKEIAAAGRALGLRLHSHLSENTDYNNYTLSKYNMRPVDWIAQHDWLGPDVWFAHLVTCEPEEVKLLFDTGTGMAHCPQENARLGSGIAPADLLADLGGTVSLAVDGAAGNEAADMITALYSAFTIHRASKGVAAISAERALHWATAGGAKVLGLEAVGTIEAGKSADLVLYETRAPRYFGQHDPLVGPIVSGGEPRIRRSYVAGREIVRDGAIPWLDMDQLAADAERVVRRMASKAA